MAYSMNTPILPKLTPGDTNTDFWNQPRAQQYAQQNPYAGFQQGIGNFNANARQYGNRALDQFLDNPMYGGTGGGAFAKYGAYGTYPLPGSTMTRDYIKDMEGGQLRDVQDYAKAAQTAAVRGQKVVGGGPTLPATMQQAIDAIARGRSGLYDKAMGYGFKISDLLSSAGGTLANVGLGLTNAELGGRRLGLEGMNAEQARASDRLRMEREDYNRDWEAARKEPERQREQQAFDQQQRQLKEQEQQRYLARIEAAYGRDAAARLRDQLKLAGSARWGPQSEAYDERLAPTLEPLNLMQKYKVPYT